MFKFGLLVFFISQILFAQNSTRAKFENVKPALTSQSQSAFRLSLLVPQYGSKTSGEVSTIDNTFTADVSGSDGMNTVGLGIGYQYLPYQQLGFIGQLGFYNVNWDSGGDSSNILKAEVSAAMAFTRKTFFKFGINNARVTSKEDANIDPGFGYQFGAGYTLANNLNVELSYNLMNFEAGIPKNIPNRELFKGDLEVEISGFELGLTGTF